MRLLIKETLVAQILSEWVEEDEEEPTPTPAPTTPTKDESTPSEVPSQATRSHDTKKVGFELSTPVIQ